MKQSPMNKWMRAFETLIMDKPERADERIDWLQAMALWERGLSVEQAAEAYKKPSEAYINKLSTVGGVI
jgi:hypothetical protein